MGTGNATLKKLGEVLEFKNGKSIKPGGLGEYPVYGSNGIIGSCDDYREQNGIIIGRVGAYCGSVSHYLGKFWASDNTIVAYPKNMNYSLVFLSYLLRELNLNRWAGGAAQPLLTQTVLKQVEAPIPPLPTQNKIAAILSAYNDLIENNLRRIKILEDMAQDLYREWFVNFRFPGHENTRFVDSPMGKIPEGWEPVPIKDFLSKNIGGSWGKEEISGDYQSKVRVIRGTDFSRIKVGTFDTIPTRYIKPKELNNRMLEAGDLLIENSVNASSRCVGTPQIITQGILKRLGDPTICASFCKLYRPKTDKYTVFLYLHMNYLLEENKMNFYQNVAANGIGNFQSQRFLQDEMIIVPSKGAEFDKLLSSIKPLLTSLYAEKTDILRQTRDLLLPKLISGEVDVSELDIKMPVEVAI